MTKFHLITLLFSLLLLTACSDDNETAASDSLPVNYINLAGTWTLTDFDGNALDADTYLRITFTRRDHTFTIEDNLQSMYGQTRTGQYTLTEDEDSETTILSGTYDNGVGEWNHSYTVTTLTATRLTLVTTDSPKETSTYTRAD